ncbi:MAG: hypothetical protein R3A80_08540 [Bdellovibrionota bacterium]
MVQYNWKKTRLLFSTLLTLFIVTHAHAEAPCTAIIDGDEHVNNYSNFAPLRERNSQVAGNEAAIQAFYDTYYRNPTSQEEARKLVGNLYNKAGWLDPSCPQKVAEHMKTHPNVYIYVGGFGQHVQLNEQYIDAAEVVKWINHRDPNALVISLGWSCDSAVSAGHTWCREKAKEYIIEDGHPIFQNLKARTKDSPTKAILEQMKPYAVSNGTAYNESLTHSLEMSAYLVNLLLSAEVNKIHFVGYSLGAQVVTEIMSFDYNPSDTKEGFPWAMRGACSNGQKICRVSELSQVEWGLAMGAPGWTPAMRNSYNAFDESTGLSPQNKAERDQYENGGLLRIQDATFNRRLPDGSLVPRELKYYGKLVVNNKRYDPTSVADDSYERGIGGSFLFEYNHYGHDYNRPYFWNKTWVNTVEKFLENKEAKNLKEWGIVWESGANFDFEDCKNSSCNPDSTYAVHQSMNSHYGLVPMRPTQAVRVVEDSGTKAVALEVASDNALKAYAMDQEDLRGSVEFSWKPKFDLASNQLHGLFSYASCEGSNEDLMPQAYVKNGELVFETRYQGRNYQAFVDAATLSSKVRKGEWAHLSFGWELPTQSLADIFNDLPTNDPQRMGMIQKYRDGIFFAAGLMRAPRTSMRKQQSTVMNPGKLSIWVNGEKLSEAPLGEFNAERNCLSKEEVISSQQFELFDGVFPAYNPFTGYFSDAITLSNGAAIGKTCKAYKIRNNPVYFGCAKSSTTNAASLMDNVRIVFGSPRTSFPEISPAGGLPKTWLQVLGLE